MNAMGYVGAIISIVAGCLGLIWPKQVSRTIGLQIPGRLGQSEVRATYGGLFIGAGVAVEASKTLPATGSDSSPLTLFGVALLATGMLFTARRRLTR